MLKQYYRNIGICAHIDAGKTSLTERILYFSGKKRKIGEVYNGEAEMDWMDQEKERGITITSAVTTIYWSGMFNNYKKHKINIIDTPGHIDFTAEVERSLRILDGVCVVFCSVGGVQPQTEIIWKQINRYNIPRIAFINKLDRVGANFTKICSQIKIMLSIIPIVIQKPYYLNEKFIGIIDLILLRRYYYNNNGEFFIDKDYIPSISDNSDRKIMIESLVENDDFYLDKYLNNNIINDDIFYLIRKLTILCRIVPIYCGSVLKNKGIQNFLDGIINFLPSPLDINKSILNSKSLNNNLNKFLALVFKVLNDEYSGRMAFIRIYYGSISKGDLVYNCNNKTIDKVGRLLEVHANKKTDIKSASYGDIISIIGLKSVNTGDTLCDKDNPVLLDTIKFPSPVISISVKPINISDSEKFFSTIKIIAFEDPTIMLSMDPITNNMIISGMGELHLDVFLERIKRISKISFIKSNPSVAYRESITNSILNSEGKYIKQSGGRGQYGHVVLNAFPRLLGKENKIINKIKGGIIPMEYIGVIKKSIIDFCLLGYLVGGKIVSIKFEIINGSFHEVDSNELSFKLATIICLKNIFKNANIIVLEPIMKVYIYSKSIYLGILTADILSRRGLINKIKNISNNEINIIALIPLRELFNFTTILRSKTKGSASFFMEFSLYKLIPNSILNIILKNKC